MNYMEYMNVVYPDNQHGFTTIPGLGHTTNTYSSAIFIEYIVMNKLNKLYLVAV